MTALLLAAWLLAAPPGQAPLAAAAPEVDLATAIGQLGKLDYQVRTRASRLVRRTPPATAVPALLDAIEQHTDGYVRYRALVLLSAFNDPKTADVMRQRAYDPNDRLREVSYAWFEKHRDVERLPMLIEALERETSEFVRPTLTRAIAALGHDPRARQVLLREVNRGQDFFRSAVIEALGDHKATWAFDALSGVAGLEGPLQDDAALALGKLGDRRALPVLAGLQRSAPRETQPTVAAAICLLGVNCEAHRGFLVRTLSFGEDTPGFQELVRGAASGLGAIAGTGDVEAARTLVEIGIPSQDPARAPIALALATLAVHHPPFILGVLEKSSDRPGALALLAEGFDMLEEDFAEEQFFAAVRRAYWAAAKDTPARQVAETVIEKLEF
jgi:HEAT repeat protein